MRAGPVPAVVALAERVPAFQIERVVRAQAVQPHARYPFVGRGGLNGRSDRWDRVYGHHPAAAKYVETAGADENGSVLVDAYAKVRRMAGDRGDEARKPSPLREMHVDNRRRKQAKPWPHAQRVIGRFLVRVIAIPADTAAEDHHRAERRRPGARSRDDQRVIRHPSAQGEVRIRPDEELKTGLISPGNENSGRLSEQGDGLLAISLLMSGQPQLADIADPEPSKRGQVCSK